MYKHTPDFLLYSLQIFYSGNVSWTYLVSASDPISSATGISFVHTSAMRSFSLLESIAAAEWNHFHSRGRSQIHNRRRQCVNMCVKRCQSTILNEHINAKADGEWKSCSNDSVPAWRKRGEMVVLFPSSVINLQPGQGGGSTLLRYLLMNVRHAGISSTSSMRLLKVLLDLWVSLLVVYVDFSFTQV